MSDYIDRLHTELLRGYEPRRRRYVVPAMAAVAVAGVVATVLLMRADAPIERSVEPVPTVDVLADVPAPGRFRPATTAEARELGSEAPAAEEIAAVPAPPGRMPTSETWFVWRDRNLVCLSVAGERACTTPTEYAAGRLLGATARTVFGLAPPDFVRAFVGEGFGPNTYSSDSELFGEDVVNGLWQLPRTIDAPIYLRRSDGTAILPFDQRRRDVEGAVAFFDVLQDDANVVEPPDIFRDLVATRFGIGRLEVHLVHDDERFREYVAVARNTVCFLTELAEDGGSVDCGPVTRPHLTEGTLVSALFENGARDAQLHFEDGTTAPLKIADNFAFAFVDRTVKEMTHLTEEGVRVTRPVSDG